MCFGSRSARCFEAGSTFSAGTTPTRARAFATEFAKRPPNEKAYRHTLAGEAESLRAALKSLRTTNLPESDYDPTFRSLAALDKENMIECYILLDAPDNGTAQDYLAYRAAHRDLLRAYIEKYDLHPA